MMGCRGSLLALLLLSPTGFSQQPATGTSDLPFGGSDPSLVVASAPADCAPIWEPCPQERSRGFLTGTRDFPHFIGPVSNPLQAIDPRSLTQIWPIFGSTWVSAFPPLAEGDIQIYGAGLNIALTDRLSLGLNQGGYAVSHFERERFLFRRLDPRTREVGRDGWLNLGGFLQYTFIADVPNQFLLTGGLRWEAPTGEAEVFQGHGPAYLAPYFTLGKEFGEAHVLATVGYEFPTGPGRATVNTFYGTLHLDRRFFGWFYPLVEFNWAYHVTRVDLDLPDRPGFFNFGNFESTGNLLTLAAGANAVLVHNRLELGAVYTTPIATQNDFDFDGLLVKMILRY